MPEINLPISSSAVKLGKQEADELVAETEAAVTNVAAETDSEQEAEVESPISASEGISFSTPEDKKRELPTAS